MCEQQADNSVPAVGALEAPRGTGTAVAVLHVPDGPDDLRRRIRSPVAGHAGHLGPGQRLRDPVRARAGMCRVDVPHALADDDVVEAVEVGLAIAVLVL